MDLPRFRTALLRWFSRTKRPLPWRRTRNPYAIWVSEVMLQQTTVATVIPFYNRFMRRFPTVASLAAAAEDEVLALWSGLGYYSRARNLRIAAIEVATIHGKRFPDDVKTALTLKGVGRYTAAAVTSMAYGTPAAAVDGNVRRVLSRVSATRALTEKQAQAIADQFLSLRVPGPWNEAMMDLGATICTPTRPRCGRCPVSTHCRGRERPEYWSAQRPRRAGLRISAQMALVERKGTILLVRNPALGLMSGLFDLPSAGLPRRAGPDLDLADRYRGILAIEHAATARIRHTVTHHRIEAAIFRARLIGTRLPEGGSLFKIEKAGRLPLSGLTRKALRAVGLMEP